MLGARQALFRMNANFSEPSWHPNLSSLIRDRVIVIESTVLKEQIEFRTLAFFDCKENTKLLSLSLKRKKAEIKRFSYSWQK